MQGGVGWANVGIGRLFWVVTAGRGAHELVPDLRRIERAALLGILGELAEPDGDGHDQPPTRAAVTARSAACRPAW